MGIGHMEHFKECSWRTKLRVQSKKRHTELWHSELQNSFKMYLILELVESTLLVGSKTGHTLQNTSKDWMESTQTFHAEHKISISLSTYAAG